MKVKTCVLLATLGVLLLLPSRSGVPRAVSAVARLCAGPDALAFSAVFSNDVVLEATGSRVWGTVAYGCAVGAVLDGLPSRLPVHLNGEGLWVVTLPAQPPSVAPRVLTVRGSGGSTLRLTLRFGKTYFCTGQSNIVGKGIDSDGSVTAALQVEGAAERADAESPLPVFTFRVGQPADEKFGAVGPRGELPPGARSFSAVCWWLARAVAAGLGGGVPVGAIESAWGASVAQAWSTPASLKACAAPPQPAQWYIPACASCLFNSHVAPFSVGPFALSGLAVYLGECNAMFEQAGYYACALPHLLRDLGAAFGGVPWAGVVELAPWEAYEFNEGVARVRAAQLATARGWAREDGSVVRAVSVAPASDCGDPAGGIHPRRKRALGLRLGRQALGGAPAGPTLASAEAVEGGAVRVTFENHTAEGGVRLAAPPPTCPAGIPAAACMGIEVQLSDGAWRPAEAAVVHGGAALLLRVAGAGGQGLAPIATRSGWSVFPLATVEGIVSGLPAHPWNVVIN